MATFITIGYGDEAGYDQTDPAVRDAAHAHDASLQASGVRMGRAGDPVQVRNRDSAGVSTTPGAFLRRTCRSPVSPSSRPPTWTKRCGWSRAPRAPWPRESSRCGRSKWAPNSVRLAKTRDFDGREVALAVG